MFVLFIFLVQVLLTITNFNLLFNIFSLRACKKGEDGGLKLKPSHKTAGHLHCVWECVCV